MTIAATVRFHRPATPRRDRHRAYKLVIDGDVKGEIRSGQELGFVVAPGRHWAQARINWSGSRRVEFEVGPGGEVRLQVEPNGSLFTFVWQIFTTDRWIRLTRV